MSREYKQTTHKKFICEISITEQITRSQPQNSYGDVKPSIGLPAEDARGVLELVLSSDTLEGLQAKIKAHVDLVE